jgi:glucosyl-3-phosphoglycerate synthase
MDFTQDIITTIHDYGAEANGRILQEIRPLVAQRPSALVLPMLARDLHGAAFDHIASELRHCDYLNEIVVALTTDREQDVEIAMKKLRGAPASVRVLWCEHPEVRRILTDMSAQSLEIPSFHGKGFAVWLGSGVADNDNYALAFHDADTENYDRTYPARLLFPIVNRELDYYYSKAYYSRITDNRFYGRVVRLFVWPFLEALQKLAQDRSPFLRYLRAFRYPLSGEFAAVSDLVANVRVPTDWGLEGGLLGEVYRNASLKRICQVDLGVYSHKHRPVGETNDQGLRRMVRDFSATIFRSVTELDGMVLSEPLLLSLRVLYHRQAQDYIRKYFADSRANGLTYDRHEEETAVEQFMLAIEDAGRAYFTDPRRNQLPDWIRALSARPTLQADLTRHTVFRAQQRDELRELAQEP